MWSDSRNNPSQLRKLKDITEGNTVVVVCAVTFNEKKQCAMGTAIYHSLSSPVAKIINMKNTFQKGRHVFAHVKHVSFRITVVKAEHEDNYFPPLQTQNKFLGLCRGEKG